MHLLGKKNRSTVTQCPWRGEGDPNTFPSSKHGRSNLKIFSIDRCPEDVPTNTKLVWNNSSPHREEKPISCGGRPPSVGHQRVKICQLSDLVNFVHFSNQLKFTQKKCQPAKLLNFTRNKRCVHSF